ncbi:CSL1 [Salix koriyanagi]|uniref:CSL1 n=1 Tax=Salix koriyanagi TaxID=2511006 RepID=A0A9Q0UX49_9ROSI|nr:CSL1 [Salix koriyanagi]
MDSSTLLDYALFQLTPTRTRCDLVLFYGDKNEKLASGLFEPFILHLQFIKDQISKVGYSIKLCPPAKNAPWFTKGTFERFVRFVSTPAVLERFVNLEREILQIEESAVQANELSNTNVAGQLEEGSGLTANTITRKSSDSSKLKDELEKSDHAALEGNSKIQFQRLLEARKNIASQRASHGLCPWPYAFGASRLREACNNFKELCKKKHSDECHAKFDKQWGYLLVTFMPNGSSDASRSDSTADSRKDGSMGTSDQIASTIAEVQVPMQWPNQIPPYMYNFQGPIPQFPPYQGYPFPTMQPIPPNYPRNMQWPSSMKEFSEGKKDKSLNKKGYKYSGEDRKTDSSDSEGRSDSDSHIDQNKNNSSIDVPYRKKHRKKSSKTVVIRNINYITPKRRNGGSDSFSGETSSDEDEYIDGDTIKKKVDDAVGSLEKIAQVKFKGVRTNESWDTFQSLLMKDDDTVDNGVEKLQPVDVRDEHFIVRSSGDGTSLRSNRAMDLGSEKLLNRMVTGDSFVVSQKDGEHQDRVRLEDIENAERFRPIMKRRDSADEDLVCSQRLEESGSGPRGILSRSTESSIIKPGKGDDWFVINHSGKPENQDAANYVLSIEGDSSNAKSSRRDVLVDDSFMVHARSAVDDSYDSQWKTMAADLTLSSQAENGTAEHNRMDAYEPNDLCVILERDSAFESIRESWVTDQGIDMSFMEGHRSSYAESGDQTEKKLPSNSDKITVKKNGINGRKVPEVRTKTVLGSPGKNRNEMMSKSKKSSFVSRPTIQKSKQEKEEEIRKKMEELAIQRQKRIAERTAAAGGAQVATKRASLESKSFKDSAKSDKNKITPRPERRAR